LETAFNDLYRILGTKDLDSLNTIEAVEFADLAEPTATFE